MRADIIHVMDAGRIIESGSHDELLEKDGIYAESWRVQMKSAADPEVTSSEVTSIDGSIRASSREHV